jgi:hypothetical protein
MASMITSLSGLLTLKQLVTHGNIVVLRTNLETYHDHQYHHLRTMTAFTRDM